MKSPLVYLTVVKLKNQIKEAVKHPAKLIYVIFLAAMLVLTIIGGGEADMKLRPLSELTAIMVLFYSMMFLITFMNGLNGGAGNYPMFTLSDVSMLFPSPLKPNKVLFYGLTRQLGLSLLLGFFLLFQYTWLHAAYGLEYVHLVMIVVGYALCLFLGQVCAMAAYTRTSGNENAQRIVRYFVYAITIGFVAWLLYSCAPSLMASVGASGEELLSAGIFEAVEKGADFLSVIGIFFPVSGWSAGVIGGVFTRDYTTVGICALLMAAAFTIALLLVIKNKNNYYEDVLQTAEVAQSAITAKKDGQPAEVTPKKVRMGKTGLGKGSGSNAMFYKHLVENRRSGVFLFSKMTIIFMIITIGCSVMYSFMFNEDGDNTAALVAVFAMSTYMQLFSESMGRFSWEISKPYIYLIPEPPFKKLLWATAETLVADCVEAVCLFVPVGLIIGLGPLETALCIIARISFALLFTSGNMMVERIFGTVRSKGLILFFYIISLMILAVPGVILGVVLLSTELVPGAVGMLLGMIAANAPVAMLVMFLCRNVLQYTEINGR